LWIDSFLLTLLVTLIDLRSVVCSKTSVSLMSFTVALLSEAFVALTALEVVGLHVSSEVVHHVADLRELGRAVVAHEQLVVALGLEIEYLDARVVLSFSFIWIQSARVLFTFNPQESLLVFKSRGVLRFKPKFLRVLAILLSPHRESTHNLTFIVMCLCVIH
jgi:hypothetical protein